jgi:hypothetical protein
MARPPRVLREQAQARAQVRRMNELARVVKRELEDATGGGDFHDLGGFHELRGEHEYTPRGVGFTMPDTPGMHR